LVLRLGVRALEPWVKPLLALPMRKFAQTESKVLGRAPPAAVA
jgi:hypothetical protein